MQKLMKHGTPKKYKNYVEISEREYIILTKKAQAFEIMKEKNIDKDRLFVFKKVKDYNFTKDNKDKLTQDQFDLLKERLK